MPATIIDDPLSVRFVLADGAVWTVDLQGLPNPGLAADLAVGLAANAHPHGGITKKTTAKGYGVAARMMVRALAEAGFTGTAADLTRGVLMRYWMASSHSRERNTRQLLRDFDTATRRLRPEVREYLAGEPVQARPEMRPYQAYSDNEWDRLETTCRTWVDESFARHRQALAVTQGGQDPLETGQDRPEDIGWLLLRNGPMSYSSQYLPYFRARTAKGRGRGRKKTFNTATGQVFRQVKEDLFPTRRTLVAYKTLLGLYCGIVPDGISNLGVGDVEWAGDATILLSYLKGRTARESSVLNRPAVRLVEQWLTHSAVLRSFADQAQRETLWIACFEGDIRGEDANGKQRRAFIREVRLRDDAGEPLVIHGGRIRATFEQRMARRGWTGRSPIDPHHSPRTEGDHYATPTDPAALDALESIINDGQADLLRKALPAVVVTNQEAARFAADFPNEVQRLGLDGDAVAELVGGGRDVFTAACADQLAGVHGPAGKPCPARPWVCLLCPLAVFLPRHAGNLLRLDAFFTRQFQQMPTEHYLRVFGPYAHRLSHDILPQLSQETRAKAALDVADDDTGIPLRPEEATV